MKVYFFLFLLLPILGLGQNSEVYVIVPKKYDFQKKDNDYQLNELTKFLLEKQNFKVFYEDDTPEEVLKNPCNSLRANVLNESGMFVSKLQLTLTDCSGKQVFASEMGKSREKDFKKAYHEALRQALSAGNKLADFRKNFKSSENKVSENNIVTSNKQISNPTAVSADNPILNEPFLYAQPNELGFQLVDNTPKIVLKIQKTSLPDIYIAQDNEGNHGLFFKNTTSRYVFEFIKNGKLERKELNVKF